MTCIEFQRLITPYIDNKLELNQLEEFIFHLNHCSECKEELEVYYTLLTGMKQLDEDKNLSGNFHIGFINRIKKSEEYIIRNRIRRLRKKLILVVCVVFSTLIFTFSSGILNDMKENSSKSKNYPLLRASEDFLKMDFYKNIKGSITEDEVYKDFNKILEYIRHNRIEGEHDGKETGIN